MSVNENQNLGAAVEDGETERSSGPWRCFHCDEEFTDREAAADHFGAGEYEEETPLCIEAATTEQKELIRTNRELWESLRKAEDENDDLEFKLSGWDYIARKLTGMPSATTHDVEHEWDFMQGRVIAAEAAINAAPKWLAQWLRRRAERKWIQANESAKRPISDPGTHGQAS